MIKETFKLENLNIEKKESSVYCNHTLSTIYPIPYVIPEIKLQINDLKDFNLLL